jgi:hypothetical protein
MTKKVVKLAFDKTSLKRKLKRGIYRVNFKKVTDGTNRIMDCTLDTNNIPAKLQPTGNGTREPIGVIRVFDTQKKGWRSFHVDSIKSFNPVVETVAASARPKKTAATSRSARTKK